MNFQTFIEKHYLPQAANELNTLLEQLQIKEQLTFCVDDYFTNTKLANIESTIVQLSFTIYNFTETINICLAQLKQNKEQTTSILAELSIRLIKETYKSSNLPKDTYFNTLKCTLQKLYLKHNWDFRQLEIILNLDNLHNYSASQVVSNSNKDLKGKKEIYLVWNELNSRPLDFFVDDVHKYCKIKSSKSIMYLLFDTLKTDFKIIIPSSHLDAFLILIQHLYNKEVILSKGSKGYFKYLRKHITPPQKDIHSTRDYNKICNEIQNDKSRKKKIESIISPILEAYTGSGLLDY